MLRKTGGGGWGRGRNEAEFPGDAEIRNADFVAVCEEAKLYSDLLQV